MRISKLEIAFGVVIALVWVWAAIWVYHDHKLRGPLAPHALSEHGDFLEQLPPLPPPTTE